MGKIYTNEREKLEAFHTQRKKNTQPYLVKFQMMVDEKISACSHL